MMMKDDEISRFRAAFAAPASEALSPDACPEPDRIWEAMRGELPPEEVRDIVDHVAVCASCAEDWRIAKAFEEEAREKEAVVHPFPSRRIQPWFAAAAAALVMTVGGIAVFRQAPKPAAEYRGVETAIEALVPPDAILPRQSFVLAWKPVPGAESYDLQVNDEELDTVAAPKDLTTTRYQVPADALARLPAGAQLNWFVTAVFPDGRRELSETFRATLN